MTGRPEGDNPSLAQTWEGHIFPNASPAPTSPSCSRDLTAGAVTLRRGGGVSCPYVALWGAQAGPRSECMPWKGPTFQAQARDTQTWYTGHPAAPGPGPKAAADQVPIMCQEDKPIKLFPGKQVPCPWGSGGLAREKSRQSALTTQLPQERGPSCLPAQSFPCLLWKKVLGLGGTLQTGLPTPAGPTCHGC